MFIKIVVERNLFFKAFETEMGQMNRPFIRIPLKSANMTINWMYPVIKMEQYAWINPGGSLVYRAGGMIDRSTQGTPYQIRYSRGEVQ